MSNFVIIAKCSRGQAFKLIVYPTYILVYLPISPCTLQPMQLLLKIHVIDVFRLLLGRMYHLQLLNKRPSANLITNLPYNQLTLAELGANVYLNYGIGMTLMSPSGKRSPHAVAPMCSNHFHEMLQ